MGDQRKVQVGGAPQRRYDDVKAASKSAADRISQATESLIGTFRQAFEPEYNRPRDQAATLAHNTAAE